MQVGNITIFLNVHRDRDGKEPHYRGKVSIGKQKYECSVWINNDLGGLPIHLSGQITQEEPDDE